LLFLLQSCQSGLWAKQGGGLGIGQTWQQPARSYGTIYTNGTPNPIEVKAYCFAANSSFPWQQGWMASYENGLNIDNGYVFSATDGATLKSDFVVPSGHTYEVTFSSSYGSWNCLWSELR
jgi:hypothetical protein